MEPKNMSLITKEELRSFFLSLINSHMKRNDPETKTEKLNSNEDNYLKMNLNVLKEENINNTSLVNYDSEGAATFCVVVIVWYFFGVVAFVTWQMRKKKAPKDYKTELLSQGLEDQVKTKLILEELRNPRMRKWAWQIYRQDKKCSKLHINPKHEMQVLANLNKRLIQIEKEKLKLQDHFVIDDLSSPITTNNINDLKKSFDEKNKFENLSGSFHESFVSQFLNLKQFRSNLSIDIEPVKRFNLIDKYLKKKSKSLNKDLNVKKSKFKLNEPEVHFDLTTLKENNNDKDNDDDENISVISVK